MSRSSRFAVAVHILVVLRNRGDKLVSSELLAASVATNAVVIRRVISTLRCAGLVTSQAGVCGGTTLAVPPERITLLDVYRALGGGEVFRIHEPNRLCPIGERIPRVLDDVLRDAQAAMEQRLAAVTIEDVCADLQACGRGGVAACPHAGPPEPPD